ncbi:MAG: hypothetical protein ACLFO1_00025 [Spirochaetaceae bacterium]
MTANRSTFARMILIAFALLAGVAVGVCASGQQEDPLEEARRLVAEGRLNEAILVLQEAVREDPEQIQEAEELLEKIRTIRGDYNDLFEQLIDNLINNPEDIETTLQIIDRMEELDEFPNERVQEQITDARIIAQLAFDRNVASNIMEDARALIQNEEYAQAVERYLTGFDLQRQRFVERDYPEAVVASADDAIRQVQDAAEQFVDVQSDFLAQEERLVAAVASEDLSEIQSNHPPFAERFQAVAALESELVEGLELMQELRSQIAGLHPDDPVDWHLRLISEFTYGPDEEGREGIFRAVDRFVFDSRSRVTQQFRDTETEVWERARRAFLEEQHDEAQADFDLLAGLTGFDQETLALATPISETPQVALPEALPEIPETFRDAFLSARTTQVAAEIQSEGAALAARNDDIPGELPENLDALAERREVQTALVEEARAQRAAWNSFVDEQLDPVGPSGPEPAATRREATTEFVGTLERTFVAREIETVDRIGEIRVAALRDRYTEIAGVLDAGVDLLTGVPQSTREAAVAVVTGGELPEEDPAVPGGEEEALPEVQEGDEDADGESEDVQVDYRYPDAGLELFQQAETQSANLQEDIQAFIGEFEEEPDYVRTSDPIQNHLAEARGLLDDLGSTQNEVAERIVEAENQIARTQELREEGDQLIAEARQATQQEEIEEARELVENARDRFFQALELQQDVDFRRDSDELVQQLGEEILEAENQIVVRRTRQLVQQAESDYDAERYQQAFDTLVEARETWERTHADDPNPEVESLLRYVNAALTLEGSRELAETEPLYPVLSNYLYVAREDFVEAQELINEGREQAADNRLVRADENLTNVTAVRPLNWEARVLKLRILQLQNAENFDEIFERRYEDALDQRDENPEEALTALETLAALDPDYPGLRQAIIDLEIELGLRPDPVTEAQIAESNQLYEEAQGIIQGNPGRAQIQAATSLLEEAVSLNPDNSQAKVLLDELRIGLGGRATVALSSEDEQLFRRAQQLFVQNNVAQAYAIVQRLLRDENNQVYAPLLELERRITARLGI